MKEKIIKILLILFSFIVSIQFCWIAYLVYVIYFQSFNPGSKEGSSQNSEPSAISPVGHAGFMSKILQLSEGYYMVNARKGGAYKLYELGTAPKINNQIIQEAKDVIAREEGVEINKLSSGNFRLPIPEGIVEKPTQEQLANSSLKLADHVIEKFPQIEGDTANHLIGGSEGTAIWSRAKNFTEVEVDEAGKIISRGTTTEVPEATRTGLLDAVHPIGDVDIVPLNKDFRISGLPAAKETFYADGQKIVEDTSYIPFGEISKEARTIVNTTEGGIPGIGLDNRAESCVYGRVNGNLRGAIVETEDGKNYLIPTLPDLYSYKGLSAMVQYEPKALQYNADLEKIGKAIADGGLYTKQDLINNTKTLVEGFNDRWPDGREYLVSRMNKTLSGSEANGEVRGLFGDMLQDSKLFPKVTEGETTAKIGTAEGTIPPKELAAIAALGGMPPTQEVEQKPIQPSNPVTDFTSLKDASSSNNQELLSRVDAYKELIKQDVPDEYKDLYQTYAGSHSTPTGQPTNYDDYIAKITGGEYQQAPPELAAAMAKYDNAVAVGQELKNDQFTGSLSPQTAGDWAGLGATLVPGVATGGFWSSLAKMTAADKLVSWVVDYPANQSLKSHQENNSQQFQDFNTENKNLLDLKKQLLDHNLGINTLSDEDLGKLKEDISASQQKLSSLESEMKTRPYGYQETSEQPSISLPESSEQVPIPASMLAERPEEKPLTDVEATKTAASGEADITTDAAPIGSVSGGGLLEKFGSYVQSGYDSIKNFFTGGPEPTIEQQISSGQQQQIRKSIATLEENVATNQKILDQINERIKEVSTGNSPDSVAKLAELNASKDRVEKSLEDSQRLLGEYRSVLPETPTPELVKPGESNTIGQTEVPQLETPTGDQKVTVQQGDRESVPSASNTVADIGVQGPSTEQLPSGMQVVTQGSKIGDMLVPGTPESLESGGFPPGSTYSEGLINVPRGGSFNGQMGDGSIANATGYPAGTVILSDGTVVIPPKEGYSPMGVTPEFPADSNAPFINRYGETVIPASPTARSPLWDGYDITGLDGNSKIVGIDANGNRVINPELAYDLSSAYQAHLITGTSPDAGLDAARDFAATQLMARNIPRDEAITWANQNIDVEAANRLFKIRSGEIDNTQTIGGTGNARTDEQGNLITNDFNGRYSGPEVGGAATEVLNMYNRNSLPSEEEFQRGMAAAESETGSGKKTATQTKGTEEQPAVEPRAEGDTGDNGKRIFTLNDQGELVDQNGQPAPKMYAAADSNTATDAGTEAAASDRGLLGRTYDSISNYVSDLGEKASQVMGFKKGEGSNTDASGNPRTHQGILDQADIGDQSSLQPGSSYEVNSEGKLVNTQTGEEFPSTQYAQGETNTANDGSRMGNQDVVSGGQQTYWDQFKGMWDDFQNRIFGTGDRSDELSQNGDRGDGTPLPNPIQPIKVAENDPEAGNNLPPIPNNEYNPSPAPEQQNIPDYAKYFSGNGTEEYPLDFNSSVDGKKMLDKITQIDWVNNDVELKPGFEKDLDGFHGYLKLDKQEILDDKRELGEITPQQEQKLLSGDSNINVPDGTEIEDKETNKDYTTDDNSKDDNSDDEIDPDKTFIKL